MPKLKTFIKRLIKYLVPTRLLGFLYRQLQENDKQLYATKALIRTDDKLPIGVLSSEFLTNDWLISRLKHISGNSPVPYFIIQETNKLLSLAAPESGYKNLIEMLLILSETAGLDLQWRSNNKYYSALGYQHAIDNLLQANWTLVRLRKADKTLRFRIENWRVKDDILIAPRGNIVSRKLYLRDDQAMRFFETPGQNLKYIFELPLEDQITFPIDVVYTWVNADDPDWKLLKAENPDPKNRENVEIRDDSTKINRIQHSDQLARQKEVESLDRFKNRDELKFSLRALLKNAPWVNKIYILTNCAPPSWADLSNSKVIWVSHSDVLDKKNLPTFNSHAIEACLHLIPNLSEHFLYSNDDIFLPKPVKPLDFFHSNGLIKFRFEHYGMVHGTKNKKDADYINAARNGQSLLLKHFGKTVTQLHQHTIFPMKVSSVRECEQAFEQAYQKTRLNKYRTLDDISPTSFLYPHFAYLSGHGVKDSTIVELIKRSDDYEKKLKKVSDNINTENFSDLPLTICINDGGGSSGDQKWNSSVNSFLEKAFPATCEAESFLPMIHDAQN